MPLVCNEAYVTLVTSDSYVSEQESWLDLQTTGTKRAIWCLAASNNFPRIPRNSQINF